MNGRKFSLRIPGNSEVGLVNEAVRVASAMEAAYDDPHNSDCVPEVKLLRSKTSWEWNVEISVHDDDRGHLMQAFAVVQFVAGAVLFDDLSKRDLPEAVGFLIPELQGHLADHNTVILRLANCLLANCRLNGCDIAETWP